MVALLSFLQRQLAVDYDILNERVLDKVTTILSLARIAIILAAQCDGSFATTSAQPAVGYKRGVGSHDLLARNSNG